MIDVTAKAKKFCCRNSRVLAPQALGVAPELLQDSDSADSVHSASAGKLKVLYDVLHAVLTIQRDVTDYPHRNLADNPFEKKFLQKDFDIVVLGPFVVSDGWPKNQSSALPWVFFGVHAQQAPVAS